MNITDIHIQALLDNELSAEEEQKVMGELQNSPEMMRRFLYLRQQKKLLQLWWTKEKENIH